MPNSKLKNKIIRKVLLTKVDPAETRTPDQSNFRKSMNPGAIKIG
jgi:hypothetical protein